MTNLAQQWALQCWDSLEAALADYDGLCIDFAGDCMAAIGRGRLAYFETPLNERWRFHAAIEIDGMVHDLWQEGPPLSLQAFMEAIGAVTVDYPAGREELTYGKCFDE